MAKVDHPFQDRHVATRASKFWVVSRNALCYLSHDIDVVYMDAFNRVSHNISHRVHRQLTAYAERVRLKVLLRICQMKILQAKDS